MGRGWSGGLALEKFSDVGVRLEVRIWGSVGIERERREMRLVVIKAARIAWLVSVALLESLLDDPSVRALLARPDLCLGHLHSSPLSTIPQ